MQDDWLQRQIPFTYNIPLGKDILHDNLIRISKVTPVSALWKVTSPSPTYITMAFGKDDSAANGFVPTLPPYMVSTSTIHPKRPQENS